MEKNPFSLSTVKDLKIALAVVGGLLGVTLSVITKSNVPIILFGVGLSLLLPNSQTEAIVYDDNQSCPDSDIPSIEETNAKMANVGGQNHIEYTETQENAKEIPETPSKTLVHTKVFKDAAPFIDDLSIAAAAASGGLSKSLNAIYENIQKITREVNDDPQQFSSVSRLFTYYIPEINNLLRVRGALVKQKDRAKIKEIDTMIGRLAAVSNDFLEKVEDVAIDEIDIDLKLLDQSLAQEIKIEINEKV